MSLYFVYLRQPGSLSDPRDDPFWEFGSFGKTGCHGRNLMHPAKTPLKKGDRLSFLQGAPNEIRLVGLTPPILVRQTDRGQLEALWDVQYRPIPLVQAPLLINNAGKSDFPAVWSILDGVRRTTYCGKAASRLRSSKQPVPEPLANQIVELFSETGLPKIESYLEAIQSPDGDWHRHGKAKGWDTLFMRNRRYHER